MIGVKELERALPPVDGKRKVLVPDSKQSVNEIMRVITDNHTEEKPYFNQQNVCVPFWQGSAESTAKLLFDFCKKHIYYVIEPEKDQTVKTPARLLSDGHGDCKHYAGFIVGICDALNKKGYPVEAYYRFVSDIPGSDVHHVFAVVTDGKKDFWVDPVISYFDKRPTFYNTKDYRMAISKLSGTHGQRSVDQVAGKNPFRSKMQLQSFMQRHGINPENFNNPADLQRAVLQKIRLQQLSNKMEGKPVMHGIEDISGTHEIGKKKSGTKKKVNFLQKIVKSYKTNADNLKKGAIKTLKNVKNLNLKVSFAAARGPLLALVALDAFRLARRYRDTVLGPGRQKFLDAWKKIGGDPKKMINAINSGWRFYIRHNRKGKPWDPGKDSVHGISGIGAFPEDNAVISGYNDGEPVVSGYGNAQVGVVQVAALVALATGLIAFLNKFVQSKTPQGSTAEAAQEGAADITASAANADEKAIYNIAEGVTTLTKSGGGQMKYETGENAEGDPVLKIDNYKHPALNAAGAQPNGSSSEDIDGGSGDSVNNTGVMDSVTTSLNKGVEWVTNNKGIVIGTVAVLALAPVAVKYLKKKFK
jgi:hypothetical protein